MSLAEQNPVERTVEIEPWPWYRDSPLSRFFSSANGMASGSQERKEGTVISSAMPVLLPGLTYLALKRAGDACFAGVALVALLPLLGIIALAIWAEDRGPILFRQIRIGDGGKPFCFFKFRSMVRDAEVLKERLLAHNEAEGPIFKMRRDPRVTQVGRWLRKYSLDELPQLLNVVRGEMSLVGPRPHLPEEVASYTERQRRRLSVRPGLVCLREVYGRSHVSFDRWVEMDLLYIKHRSILTDLHILLRAVPVVLKGDGAY